MQQFEQVHQMVERENTKWALGCTEFELLTATAYKIFELENVQLALVEVGLGGTLDATNVLEPATDEFPGGVVACGITKIGIDHESFLGSTLLEIALKKAGIIKPGVPVVVDGTNAPEVLAVVREKALREKCLLVEAEAAKTPGLFEYLSLSKLVGSYQAQNLSVALNLVQILRKHSFAIPDGAVSEGVGATKWPGRLQTLVDPETGLSVLLDGAHNESAAIELGQYLTQIRAENKNGSHASVPKDSSSVDSTSNTNGLIFVVAMTNGKAADKIFLHVTQRNTDTVYAATFTPPLNMPTVKCYTAEKLASIAQNYVTDVRIAPTTVREIFTQLQANRLAGDHRSIVICGSLYLCSDILRTLGDAATHSSMGSTTTGH